MEEQKNQQSIILDYTTNFESYLVFKKQLIEITMAENIAENALNPIEKFRIEFLKSFKNKEILFAFSQISDLQIKSLLSTNENKEEECKKYLIEYIEFRFFYSKIWLINEISLQKIIQDNIIFPIKNDKEGNICYIVTTRNFQQIKYDTEEVLRFLFYNVEKVLENLQRAKKEKFVIIWDRDGFVKEKNYKEEVGQIFGMKRVAFVNNFLQLLHKVYVCNISLFYRMLYNVAKLGFPRKYTNKISLLGKNEDLLQFFDRDCLPKEFLERDEEI